MPSKKRTQKQKQTQKQSVVVNVKVERPARRKRTKRTTAAIAGAAAPEMRQLPPVSYIMQGGTNMPYWSASYPTTPISPPLSVSASKPLSIPSMASVPKPIPIPSSERVAFITPIDEAEPVAISPKKPESVSSLGLPLSLKKPESVSSLGPPSQMSPLSFVEELPKRKFKKVTSNISRIALTEILKKEFDQDPEFLKTFKNKREMYRYYKQLTSTAQEQQEVLNVAQEYGISPVAKKQASIETESTIVIPSQTAPSKMSEPTPEFMREPEKPSALSVISSPPKKKSTPFFFAEPENPKYRPLKITKKTNKSDLEDLLVQQYGMDREMLKDKYKTKTQLYEYYKSIEFGSPTIPLESLEFEKFQPPIMQQEPASKPFWDIAIGVEEDPELRK